MSIGLFGLVTIGTVLSISPALIYIYQGSTSSTSAKILSGIARLIQIVGFAALAASIVVFFLPMLLQSDLDLKNLTELNELVESYHRYLEFSWVVFVLGIATLLGLAWVGRLELKSSNAKIVHKAIKAISVAKLVVGILAACTFIGGELHGRIQDGIADTEAEKKKIVELELEVFSKAERVLVRDVIVETFAQASKTNSSVIQIQTAYHLAVPYLPIRVSAGSTANWTSRSRAEFVRKQLDRSVQDLSQRGGFVDEAARTQSGRDELTDDFVELVFDEGIAGPVKSHLLGLGNPVLSALVDAFVDPLFLDAAKQKAAEEASAYLNNQVDFASARDRLSSSVQTIAARFASRLVPVHVQSNASLTLGDPTWDTVRLSLSDGVNQGIKGKSKAVQDEARRTISSFEELRQNFVLIFQDLKTKRKNGEEAFVRYLYKNPDYAALWGYAMIISTPLQYKSDLKTISINGSGQKIDELRKTIVLASDGNTEAKTILNDLGIDEDTPTTVSDEFLANALYDTHGPYPIDGFQLYFNKMDNQTAADAIEYYRGPAVSRSVNKFCPSN